MHFIYSCHARHGRTEVGIRDVVGTQHAKGRTSMRSSALCLSHPRSSGAASTTGRLPAVLGRLKRTRSGRDMPRSFHAQLAASHSFPLSTFHFPPAHARPCLTPPMDSQLQTGGGSATMGRKRGRLPCWMCAIRA